MTHGYEPSDKHQKPWPESQFGKADEETVFNFMKETHLLKTKQSTTPES